MTSEAVRWDAVHYSAMAVAACALLFLNWNAWASQSVDDRIAAAARRIAATFGRKLSAARRKDLESAIRFLIHNAFTLGETHDEERAIHPPGRGGDRTVDRGPVRE